MHLRGYSGNGDSTVPVQGGDKELFSGRAEAKIRFSIQRDALRATA
jgi:hypothetical protein